MTFRKIYWLIAIAGVLCVAAAPPVAAKEKPPEEWDGLRKTKIKGLGLAYVRPGADMSIYSKIILDPLQVEFSKNWKPEAPGSNRKLSQQDMDTVKQRLTDLATETFTKEISSDGGYPVVTERGPDVMRISAALLDVYVTAPDVGSPGLTRTYVADTGRMTLIAELRDSETNALFARVVDAREARNSQTLSLSNRAENAHEAGKIVREWARILRRQLDAVRANPKGADE